MPDLSSVKREMLRAAVRENVDGIDGKPPRSLRRAPMRRSYRMLLLIVVPAALFVSVNAISTGSASRQEVVLVSPSSAGAPADMAPPASFSLPAPRRIDPNVFRLSVEKIILDPGHGGADPGAHTDFGLTEKAITLDVGLRLRALLLQDSFKVAMTRETDTGVSLKQRASFANGERGDLFVSIHVNAMPMPDIHSVETYYLGASDDPHVKSLAGAENQGSGYSLADYRKLLEGIYVDVRQSESKTFAGAVQSGLFTSLQKVNTTIQNRGVKQAPFVVLTATEMPGILAEVSCVTNEDDARRLQDPKYRQSIARALYQGIKAYAQERNHPTEKGS